MVLFVRRQEVELHSKVEVSIPRNTWDGLWCTPEIRPSHVNHRIDGSFKDPPPKKF